MFIMNTHIIYHAAPLIMHELWLIIPHTSFTIINYRESSICPVRHIKHGGSGGLAPIIF